MKVVLKPGRDKAVRNRHPWIFSGAVASFPPFEAGEILPVHAASGEFLAQGYFHPTNSISGRLLAFSKEPIQEVIARKIAEALQFRRRLFDPQQTSCFRLINAEGDGLPGLIVDVYGDQLVMQVNTCGMERLKPLIVAQLSLLFNPRGIYERSHSQARRQEGLPDQEGVLFGECPLEVVVKENGLLFAVPIQTGQKTGFFLDQREMRQKIGALSKGQRVLNCFAYSGGFSLFALQGGAQSVTSVDVSQEACASAAANTLLNHFAPAQHQVICADVFDFLKMHTEEYGVVILDPPAFAKKRQDINEACRGYKEINRRAMEKMAPGSFLLTSSCSHFVDANLFQQVVFQAAVEAGRTVTICSSHLQAADHPVSLFHPEGSYLKSFLLYVM